MTPTLQALADDPSLYLFTIDAAAAHFQKMTPESFRRSIFLDNRMVGAGERMHLPAAVVRQVDWPAPASRPVATIFHVAQCGSTLLARALDVPGRSLVLREPAALRAVGVEAAVRGAPDDHMLKFTLSMLGKRWQDDAPVIIKANVPVNFMAEAMVELEGDAPAILLYFPLGAYIAAVMRTPGHEQWVESVFAELQLAKSAVASHLVPRTTAERAACLWLAQMQQFAAVSSRFAQVRTLWAKHLFEQPARVIHDAATLFGVKLSEDEAADIAASELFETYSKNPTLDYDLEVRAAREEEARRRLAPQIEEASRWVEGSPLAASLPAALGQPLTGPAATLVS